MRRFHFINVCKVRVYEKAPILNLWVPLRSWVAL